MLTSKHHKHSIQYVYSCYNVGFVISLTRSRCKVVLLTIEIGIEIIYWGYSTTSGHRTCRGVHVL